MELRNSLADLFFAGDVTVVPELREGTADGFDNQYDELSVHLDFYASLQTLAEHVGAAVATRSERLLDCDQHGLSDRRCASRFAELYARQAYRRPVSPDEVANLLSVYDTAREFSSHDEAVGAMAGAMVMSPLFLYRTELGGEVDEEGHVRLTSHERAALLSYFLWRTTPDAELRAAADTDALRNEEELRTQVERMLQDRRARSTLRQMLMDWLQVRATEAAKDDPDFTSEVAAAMQRELGDFVDDRWSDEGDSFDALWRDPSAHVTRDLEGIYEGIPDEREPMWTELDPSARAGILTRPAFIASHTPRNEFSPIHLGALIRRNVLCQELPDPPDQIPEAPQDPDLSVREKFQEHKDNPGCAGCHELMDPIGFAFEVYDPVGRYITEDRGTPVTGEGALAGTDVDGPLWGAVQLSERLAESDLVKRCFVAAVLQFMAGRPVMVPSKRVSMDYEVIDRIVHGAFAEGNMRAVVIEAVMTRAFTLRDGSALSAPNVSPSAGESR